jgi:hypothetical protein
VLQVELLRCTSGGKYSSTVTTFPDAVAFLIFLVKPFALAIKLSSI